MTSTVVLRFIHADTSTVDYGPTEVEVGEVGLPVVKISREIYQDMDEPNLITLTIEPGDRLNVS